MNFSDALMCLKRGDKMRRQAWDGERFLVISEEEESDPILEAFMVLGEWADQTWLASQTDILADDWVQVE